MPQARENLFVSYCREERKWLEMFQRMLAPLVQQDKFKIWDDSQITPGTKWYEEIQKAVDSAKVALLLVSPRFLASDFIINHELPLLKAARADGLTIQWVVISRCMYQLTDLADYQALHDPARTLDSLSASRLNDEMYQICKKIRNAMEPPKQNGMQHHN